MLYKKVFHGIYRNNEVYFSTAGALAFIFSYEFDPCADLDFDDEEYDGGADEDCDDIAANLGVPCSIWKWNMETGELSTLLFSRCSSYASDCYISDRKRRFFDT